MPDCYLCLPTCENCKPKMCICQKCGMQTFIDLGVCPRCKATISEASREEAWDQWRLRHAGKPTE